MASAPVRRSRRRLLPEARRAELINAASRVLRKHGIAGCRVEDITAAARAAKGTFYLYFSSWDDLLVAVRNHILDQYAAQVRNRLAQEDKVDWWRTLDSECVLFVDFVVDLGGLHDAIFHGAIEDRRIEYKRSAAALISELLRAGVEAKAFNPVDIEPSAELLFSVLHATADGVIAGGDRKRLLKSQQLLLHRWLSLRLEGAS